MFSAMESFLGEDQQRELGFGDEAVRVVVRIRPQEEAELGKRPVVKAVDERTCSVEGAERTHRFSFDRVFPEFADQDMIYDEVGRPMLDSLLRGVNCAILAYGQTGSGKTHTMQGPADDRGIIPRMFEEIFDRLRREKAVFDVRASAVEIYQERIFDLITLGRTGLDIRENAENDLLLIGATQCPLTSGRAALRLFEDAVSHRKVYETNMNTESSRSHAVFILNIGRQDPTSKTITFSQLYLVDLAGSEKVWKTAATGDRLEEAKFINRSLLALGRVITKLVDGSEHVPYRDSKLTRLLQNSIGGNSKTALIVCASPSGWNAQETISSLRFGTVTQRIRNAATVNEQVDDSQLAHLLEVTTMRSRRNEDILQQCKGAYTQFLGLFHELGVPEKEIAKITAAMDRLERQEALIARGEDPETSHPSPSSPRSSPAPAAVQRSRDRRSASDDGPAPAAGAGHSTPPPRRPRTQRGRASSAEDSSPASAPTGIASPPVAHRPASASPARQQVPSFVARMQADVDRRKERDELREAEWTRYGRPPRPARPSPARPSPGRGGRREAALGVGQDGARPLTPSPQASAASTGSAPLSIEGIRREKNDD